MPIRLSNLWRWTGTVDRAPYFVIGVALVALKFGLDWLVAGLIFDRAWTLPDYVAAPSQTPRVFDLTDPDRFFFGTLLVLALPFIWVGVALTVQRLRAARLPPGLVIFFFVPVVNLFFFVVLSLLPTQPARSAQREEEVNPELGRIMGPEQFVGFRTAHHRLTHGNAWPSAGIALMISVPSGLGFVCLSIHGLHNYGWGLFVGMPFCLSLGSVLLYGLSRPQGFADCLGLAFAATSLVGLGTLVFALEGFICLLMAAPIGYFLTFLGALVGYAIQLRPWSNQESPYLMLALMMSLPALMGAEAAVSAEPPLLEVRSSIDIDAPPEAVWSHVLSFPPLPEPDERLFQVGIAYPMRAEIHGEGPGAVRHCIFSTGTFVEPIEVWDAPRLLRFRVTDQPEPMREWSPFEIHPPHLDHYLVSERGQFRLTRLANGGTRLEGTTWYTNRMWPAAYWQLWSDHIIHRIHLRVLDHIKNQVENPPQPQAKKRNIPPYDPPKGYVCYRAERPIKVDGKLDDPAWRNAPWTDDFVDIEGDARPQPRFRTRVKMLWDDDYFYVGVEMEEPHVWATLTTHDSVIFHDNDFEVFIDPNGDNHEYYEFEINALNTGWDLLLPRPYRDGGKAVNSWEIPGLKTAVHVGGTLNDPRDVDRGWSVELAFPWQVLGELAYQPAPPKDGDQWRVNFSRVEWQHEIVDGKYRKVKGKKEDNWVWSPQGVIDMHRPERWGYVQFSTAKPGTAKFRPDPTGPARHVLHQIYYAQRDYQKEHGRWAKSLDDLGLQDLRHENLAGPPVLQTTASLFQATVEVKLGERQRWHIRQDSKIWRD